MRRVIPLEARILGTLSDDPSWVTDMARLYEVDRSSVWYAVRELKRDGLVNVSVGPRYCEETGDLLDSRSALVELTDEGADRLLEIVDLMNAFVGGDL